MYLYLKRDHMIQLVTGAVSISVSHLGACLSFVVRSPLTLQFFTAVGVLPPPKTKLDPCVMLVLGLVLFTVFTKC